MFACTGQVTQGKLGTRLIWSPCPARRASLGMARRSPARKPGIESKMTCSLMGKILIVGQAKA